MSTSNPFSLKTDGFMCGAGHGTNDMDQFGNHWHFTTMVIADKHPWERRIGMFPTFIDRDGLLHSDTRFGDYPHRIPDCRLEKETDLFLGWMLQSFEVTPRTTMMSVATVPTVRKSRSTISVRMRSHS